MKLYFFIAVIACTFVQKAIACDLCGNGAGSDYAFGVLPQYHRNFVGIRYLYREFSSEHPEGTLQLGNTQTKETNQTADILVRWYLTPRLQLLANLPVQSFLRVSDTKSESLRGIGDASFLLNYIIWEQSSGDSTHLLTQKILIGGGVKVPTGTTTTLDENGSINPNFQLGTGTVDVLGTLTYNLRYNHWGMNCTAAYRYNTFNAQTYKFGNSWRTNTQFFYWYQAKHFSLLPTLGIQYEQNDRDRKTTGFYDNQTGGYSLWATAGLDVYYKNWALGLSYQKPTVQNLNNGLTLASPRYQAQLFYSF